MLSFLFSFSLSAVIGIDVGGDNLRAAVIRTGQNIEILNSAEAERKFPIIFTVIPNQENHYLLKNGSISKLPDIINTTDVNNFTFLFNDWNSIKKYPNFTVRYPTILMAKVPTDELAEMAERRRLWGVPSLYHDERVLSAGVLPEISIHRAFLKINMTIVASNEGKGKIERMVIAVPDFYPQQERDSLRAMAKSIKFKPFIADQMRVLSTWYAYHNYKIIPHNRTRMIFFLFGETNLQIALMTMQKMKNGTVTINRDRYAFDDTIGGRDVDVAIADFLAKQFKHPITPKAEQILLIEAEKVKKKLTVLDSVSGLIDSLDGTNDLMYTITVEDYKKLLTPILKNITICAQKITPFISGRKPINRVMLIGGSSRIPYVQEHVKKIFSTKQIYTSMLKDEMIATAAAMFCASMQSEYLLPPVNYTFTPLYKIELRTEKAVLPFNGTLPFKNCNYWLQETSDFFPTGSSIFMVWNIATTNTTMRLTNDGLWRFKDAHLKKFYVWRDQLIATAFTIERQELEREELEKLVNTMEYLLLETKETITDECDYATEQEKKSLQYAFNVTNRWFISQKKYEKKLLKYRIQMLEDAVGSVLCRAQNSHFLPQAVNNLTQAIEFAHSHIEQWSIRSKRPSRQDIRRLIRLIIETKEWYKEMERRQKRLSDIENPLLTWTTVAKKTNAIVKFVQDLTSELEQTQKPKKQNKEMHDGVYVYPPRE